MKTRNSARAIILSSSNRVLLFKLSFHDMTDSINPGIKEFWITPGGGLEEGEAYPDALRRELLEEAGIVLQDEPPWVWTREVVLEWQGEQILSHERYYMVRVESETLGAAALTENEKARFQGRRWWGLQEIRDSGEGFRPPGIAAEIESLLDALSKGALAGPPVLID